MIVSEVIGQPIGNSHEDDGFAEHLNKCSTASAHTFRGHLRTSECPSAG
jgi:hypothetical protein